MEKFTAIEATTVNGETFSLFVGLGPSFSCYLSPEATFKDVTVDGWVGCLEGGFIGVINQGTQEQKPRNPKQSSEEEKGDFRYSPYQKGN